MLWDERSKQAVEAWGSIDVLRTRGRAIVFFPLRRHLKPAFSVSLLAHDCLSRIQTILFYMETIGLTDADCKMGLAFGRSNKRADCMDDSGVHATRVEWPLRVQASR